ncbi:MAG: hypothetical protein KUA35_10220 [Pseudodesulfovibrio sp.]|uniref:Mu-like prophage FluMu N-terminal domain-containing protein n=1 Tax=Pseudodesulfovibrio aespoeensis (strain ATCC 700646 / DSM 10631 / Aspo-2) TaxID=643562 RepID=E6VU99_PSEA9|nr:MULTISPECIES: HI1506-related protein [Pseudodesulfovibrio]MBU4191339.1 hypothetical protein [Pseudomonadota bacterium]ADU63406.1 hypothetical protein Daes_2401 [Pseudodesulfovibrio aespoeensis Aspo-2]MBU4243453.1 hypothetical protein [Pseudomonadota bacterium]MBU4378631.1 hypothetical protein [Pseudomonadota bacterium]MBU4473787.1 hypothetical protein [Pseudomonadota bacterium]
MPVIITAKHDGFRRCGVAHPAKPTEHPDDRFTEAELAVLKADPNLVVHQVKATADAKVVADAKVSADKVAAKSKTTPKGTGK